MSYGQLGDFLAKIQDGQAPANFSQQHLKDIGFGSSNHRAYIPLLKAIGFLTPSGAPTERYHLYRDKSQARAVLGAALKDAYSDLFVIKANPTERDRDLIQGKFKSAHNASDRVAELMAKTFFGLLKQADIDHEPLKQKSAVGQEESPTPVAPVPATQPAAHVKAPGLHYNIQIHLPATKDVEVYNAIFKSLKEHLIG
ncbi:MAG: DUF5343 domain-containing protein [Hydrogenophaga sp.]|uniref:DUF5343 domain-containing protein n=1 Tax=Hydrogenophaga sp. TaxID=1904254 RepID=UPI0026333F86|nr:DUF5343 domain-containing protein [Hydrogenophaga sp.]MCV0439383.1 DUF5343 domain-containing protein [Hydrogenophaga sp.]